MPNLETVPDALVERMAKILAFVDLGPGEPPAEYMDFAREVCEAVYLDGLQITPQDEVLSANEAGEDVSWGTAHD